MSAKEKTNNLTHLSFSVNSQPKNRSLLNPDFPSQGIVQEAHLVSVGQGLGKGAGAARGHSHGQGVGVILLLQPAGQKSGHHGISRPHRVDQRPLRRGKRPDRPRLICQDRALAAHGHQHIFRSQFPQPGRPRCRLLQRPGTGAGQLSQLIPLLMAVMDRPEQLENLAHES